MQRVGVKQMQRPFLDQVMQVASEIGMPSFNDEEANALIECQRLLSPGSEQEVARIRQWSKPATENAALG